jgi:hypothetical protein
VSRGKKNDGDDERASDVEKERTAESSIFFIQLIKDS